MAPSAWSTHPLYLVIGSTFLPLTLPCRRSGTSNVGLVCAFGAVVSGHVSLPEVRVCPLRGRLHHQPG